MITYVGSNEGGENGIHRRSRVRKHSLSWLSGGWVRSPPCGSRVVESLLGIIVAGSSRTPRPRYGLLYRENTLFTISPESAPVSVQEEGSSKGTEGFVHKDFVRVNCQVVNMCTVAGCVLGYVLLGTTRVSLRVSSSSRTHWRERVPSESIGESGTICSSPSSKGRQQEGCSAHLKGAHLLRIFRPNAVTSCADWESMRPNS